MSEKPYSAKRWTDVPEPKAIGNFEITEQEKEQYDKELKSLMKQAGVLKDNKHSIS